MNRVGVAVLLGVFSVPCSGLTGEASVQGILSPRGKFQWGRAEKKKFHSTSLYRASQEGEFLRSKSHLREKVSSLLLHKHLIPIDRICSALVLDRTACLRVETYIGKTLLKQERPLYLKHKVNDQGFNNDGAKVMTKNGLQDLHAELLDYLPTDTAGNLPFIVADDFDYTQTFAYPTLVGPAPVPDTSGNRVIARLYRHDYEDPVLQLSNIDVVPFQEKLDALVWRGSTRPLISLSCTGHRSQNRSRKLLVKKYFDSDDPRINIAFVDNISPDVPPCQVRDHMDMESLLKHKFVMVLDDTLDDSSMEWVMASNSVPFMAKPVLQTWALHSWLVPWKHYVPVEADFSDLRAKLDWAASYPQKAEQIARHGAAFMQEFQDKDRENRINAAVLVAYLNRFQIEEDSTEEASLVRDRSESIC